MDLFFYVSPATHARLTLDLLRARESSLININNANLSREIKDGAIYIIDTLVSLTKHHFVSGAVFDNLSQIEKKLLDISQIKVPNAYKKSLEVVYKYFYNDLIDILISIYDDSLKLMSTAVIDFFNQTDKSLKSNFKAKLESRRYKNVK